MSVLIEGVCVVVRRQAIEQKVLGGWQQFLGAVPNETCCYDEDLARVGFMRNEDVELFVMHLQALGLAGPHVTSATDMAVVDQVVGPTFEAPWLELRGLYFPEFGGAVNIALLKGATVDGFVAPENWSFDGSMSQHPMRVSEPSDRNLKFLRSQEGVDVYWNQELSREVYSARTYTASDQAPPLDDAAREKHNELFRRASEIYDTENVRDLLPPASAGWLASRRIGKAVTLLDEVIKIAPNNGTAHWLRAKFLQAVGKYEDSLDGFSKAWLIKPGDIDTAREAGISAMEVGKVDVALYFAREALRLSPNNNGLRANIAMFLLFAGDIDSAIKEINTAAVAEPNDPITQAVQVLVQEVEAGRMRRPTRSREIDNKALKAALARRRPLKAPS
jgi:tetratricopeptide (TPR) repeat protein